jgi:hypothetical protein
MTDLFHAARAALPCLLAGACLGAAAQTSAPATAADPQAAVPATRYQPAFAWRVEPPPSASPDRRWQDSNAVVAGKPPMTMAMPMPDTPAAHAAHAATDATQPQPAAPMAHMHHPGMAMPPAPQQEQR